MNLNNEKIPVEIARPDLLDNLINSGKEISNAIKDFLTGAIIAAVIPQLEFPCIATSVMSDLSNINKPVYTKRQLQRTLDSLYHKQDELSFIARSARAEINNSTELAEKYCGNLCNKSLANYIADRSNQVAILESDLKKINKQIEAVKQIINDY